MKSKRPPAPTVAESKPNAAEIPASVSPLTRRHLQFGWWNLLVFLSVGLVLEALHGFKVEAYLNVSNETRRLMWTLAHAHGTLLGLVNLAFAVTLRLLPKWPERTQSLASACLLAATLLMPAGFFLGGMVIYAGDPGLGIVLVPVGGILLFISVLLVCLALNPPNP